MRRRLALLVSATMAVVLFAFAIPLAFLVRVLAADRAQTMAVSDAQQLSAVVATTQGADLRASVQQLIEASGHPDTVFLPDGTRLGVDAPRTPAVELASLGRSLTVKDPAGREILVAVQSNGGTVVIRAFVSDAAMSRGLARAWLILAAFGLVLLALGVAVADRLVGAVTRPIGELARVSHRLAAGELDARASLAGPREVREVAQSLNHLAGRIRDLIWQERESIADLSHRLRTPLTVLRLEAETVPESADPDGRLAAQVRALENAVTALIEDSRRRSGGPGSCDATQVISERAAFWSVLADDQGRGMRVEVPDGPVLVGVAAADLAACLDALLGNVFAHTPEGTAFTVRLRARAAGGGQAAVEDAGPGFTDVDPVRRGASGGGSTGLGLDIARQIAEASGGSLTVGNGPAGGVTGGKGSGGKGSGGKETGGKETDGKGSGGGHVIIELGPPQPAGPSA